MKKRLLSLGLALVMCLGLLPAPASAGANALQPNLAENVTIHGASAESESIYESPSRAFDGNRSGSMWSLPRNEGWFVFSLEKPMEAGSMVVYHEGYGSSVEQPHNTRSYWLEMLDTSRISEEQFLASGNKQAIMENDDYWLHIASEVNNKADATQTRLKYYDSRRVFRFRVDDGGWDHRIRVYEIEFYKEVIEPTDFRVDNFEVAVSDSKNVEVIFAPVYTEAELLYQIQDPEIATVNEWGIVTGVKPGTTLLTITNAKDPLMTKTVGVTVRTDSRTHRLPGYEPLWMESFEAEKLPSGWFTDDRDGDCNNWELNGDDLDEDYKHHGTHCMVSHSFSYEGEALTPDNWLISPAFHVEDGDLLSICLRGMNPVSGREKVGVYVKLYGGVISEQVGEDFTTSGRWQTFYVDLSAYKGQDVGIAIVHHNVTNQSAVCLDCVYAWRKSEAAAQGTILASPDKLTGGGEVQLRVTEGMTAPVCDEPSIQVTEDRTGEGFVWYSAVLPDTPRTYTFTSMDGEKQVSCTVDVLPKQMFTDVKEGDWFYKPVQWAVENGITSGMSKTEFGAFAPCNRAQIVTFLWSAAGKPEPASDRNPFADVKESDWFYKAVLWAVENGITSGLTGTEFGPGAICNRAQAVTFLWKYEKQPDASAELQFTDVKPGAWYEKPVRWAVENNITSGLSQTEFGTTANCLRSQIVTFMYRALEQ